MVLLELLLAALPCVLSGGLAEDSVGDGQALVQAQLRQIPTNLLAEEADGSLEAPRRSRRQELRNFQDTQYFANISVGGQVLTGILDTGSFELVVFEKHCSGCGMAAKYDHSQSRSYRSGELKRNLYYGSGDIYAREAFDLVSVGHFGKINQSFWETFDAIMPVLEKAEFQSIVGMGPPEMPAYEAWSRTARSIRRMGTGVLDDGSKERALRKLADETRFSVGMSHLNTMIANYGVSDFSVCLGRRPSSNGFFVWNDTAPLELPLRFKRVPVIGRHTWTVNMSRVRLVSKNSGQIPMSCSEGCGAIVDTGTSFLTMPTTVVDLLQELHLKNHGDWLAYRSARRRSALRRPNEEALNQMDVNCSNMRELPSLVFTLGEHTFSLPPDAYIAKVTHRLSSRVASLMRVRQLSFPEGRCELSVMESTRKTSYGPLWILGMPFFRSYYTTFRVGRTREQRALLIAKASPGCYPANAAETTLFLDRTEEAFRREMDLRSVYISPLVKQAIGSEPVEL